MKLSNGSPKHKQLMEAGGVSKLHLAVFQGKQDKVTRLLEKGCPDVNKGDKFGQTPLHIACHREGLLGCLKLLASHQANLEALDANGNTALHSAAGSGATAAAEFLLGRGLSVADENKDGHTPMDICKLHCPAEKQPSMKALLEGGAKVEEDRAAGGDSTAADYSAATPSTTLSTPAHKGSSAATKDAAAAAKIAPAFGGSAAGTKDSLMAICNDTAEHHAGPASGDKVVPDRLRAAAKRNAGMEAGAWGGWTADSPAAPVPTAPSNAGASSSNGSGSGSGSGSSRGDLPSGKGAEDGGTGATGGGGGGGGGGDGGIEEYKQSANPNSMLFTPSRGAAKMGALSREHRRGADTTPAAAAAPAPAPAPAPGARASAGTEAGQPSSGKRSASKTSLQELHLAIFEGDTAKVEAVVERGDLAALNQADRHGQTPLHLACYKGSRVMTRLLVEGGADLEAVDVNGNGVVHAAVCDSPAVLAILIDDGADVTVANYDGLTPKRLCEQYCPPRLRDKMLHLIKEATLAQVKATARKEQLAEEQMNIEAVYHQLAMLRSKLAATAAAKTGVPASEAAEGTQTENALLTLVEANVRVVEGQRHALENMEKTATRLERMFRRLHMRLDAVNPGDVSFS